MHRFFNNLLLATFLLVIVGCESDPNAQLDEELSAMIRRRQAADLGPGNQNDARRVPPRNALNERTTAQDYERSPWTRNPSLDRLPGAMATTHPATMPDMLMVPPDAPEYDLTQFLMYGIEHSPEYRAAKDDLFLTVLSVLVQRHLWGPRFFDNVTQQFAGTPEPGDKPRATQLINELGVSQKLPYGGEVSVSALTDFVEGVRDAQYDGSTGTAFKIEGTIPLLRGSGESAREELIQAEREVVYAVRAFEQFRREYLVRVSSQYYELLRLQGQIRNRQQQVTNYLTLSARITALATAGRQPYFEVERAKQQVFFAQNNLVNDTEQYASTLDSLKFLTGMPMNQAVRIVPTEAVIPEPELDAANATQTAWQLRLDLQTTQDRISDAKRKLEVAKNQTLPNLDLFANSVFLPADRGVTRTAPLDTSVTNNSYVAGAKFGVPLDRRVEELDVRKAKVVLERAMREFDQSRDQVSQQVRRDIRQIEQSRFSLELQNSNITLAKRREKGVLLRFRNLTPQDFITSQEDLLSALNRRDEALRSLRVSILQYLLDTGQMRVSSQGQWQPPAKLVPILPESASAQTQPFAKAATQPATQPAMQPAPPLPPVMENPTTLPASVEVEKMIQENKTDSDVEKQEK